MVLLLGLLTIADPSLVTFMKMCEPGWFMKVMIIGAQGVFFNAVFLSYLISPKITHRFVGYLEGKKPWINRRLFCILRTNELSPTEEAVHTYTRCIREIDEGLLTKWSDPNFEIPDIAVQYWKIPEGMRTMKNLILYIRVRMGTV